MTNLYKLTDSDGKTRGDTQWGPGVSHSSTGEGGLCGSGWIHAYEHPLIAVLMNPIHGDFKNPRLWEAEGEIGLRDGQLKCGCATLTTIREIPLPEITTEMQVRFAIMCAKEASTADAAEAWKAWNAWADRWLSGEDRTQAAADAAWAAAARAWAAWAWAARAWAAWAWAARAATDAAWAAARAAMETGEGADIFAIAEKACSGPT